LQANSNPMITDLLVTTCCEAIQELYGQTFPSTSVGIEKTKKDISGDYTIVVFPFVKLSRKSPEATATEIGNYLEEHITMIDRFDVIKGFLNISISHLFWLDFLGKNFLNKEFGFRKATSNPPVLVEFSSPNTNKPLHLGHIRNNLLGFSLSEIPKANGHKVQKLNLVNDRGIHICKSMLAYMKWGEEETPSSAKMKGDHLIGKYYVLFDQHYKKEMAGLMEKGLTEEEAGKQVPLMTEAREILVKWEAHDREVHELWHKMNGWVYEGFTETYKRLGITFDKIQYESETYLLGKAIVEEGLENGILFQKADNSVWIDLTGEGLDQKLLLRSDGTSVYMTQDLGTAQLRYDTWKPSRMIYVVGNEQNYHFDVLRIVLKKLDREWSDNILHLSYGMVELPEGKMKSREGTVVDADDLMDEMYNTAEKTTRELGKVDSFTEEEASHLFHTLSLGALKYFILKVDPKKNMVFDPKESIDFNGNTGPFIQYTFARIQSLLRKAADAGYKPKLPEKDVKMDVLPVEKEILKILFQFPDCVKQAGEEMSPAIVANYTFELVKEYNQFYQEIPILKEEDEAKIHFRLALSEFTAGVIRKGMKLMGIEVPSRM
jgi:arginyl-tRNA synthetase